MDALLFCCIRQDLFKSLAIRCLKNLKKYLQNNRDMGVVYRLERSIIYIERNIFFGASLVDVSFFVR